jgi:hypothetical protein
MPLKDSTAQKASDEGETQGRSVDPQLLKKGIIQSLKLQGFAVNSDGQIDPVSPGDKDAIRRLHAASQKAAINRAKEGLRRHEQRLIERFAHGSRLDPASIRPRLVEIHPGSEEELLFRYARLHWSIPISAGYGRRLRFAIFDESNDMLMGILGLGDPVFAIGPRDKWIGWTGATKRRQLRHVMDAFVVGAVPPYSNLLCGKYIASLVTSDEVRDAFRRKYRNTTSLISDRNFDGRLALVTTTSALGRSSLYNRIRLGGRKILEPVGYTAGSGEFHFSNGIYGDIVAFANAHFEPTAKNERWGEGWRSRREVVRRTLRELDLQPDMVYHGVRREIYVAPLASNSREFLCGEHSRVQWYHTSAPELFDSFRERWLMPRATRDTRYRNFEPETLRLWPK